MILRAEQAVACTELIYGDFGTLVQCYGTQFMLETSLNSLLVQHIFNKLHECRGGLSELLIDSITDESETNYPIKLTHPKNNKEVVYLSNSAKQKQAEDAVDIGQGVDRLPSGTSKMMTDVAMVPPIFMAGLRSASYKTKRSDRTLTGATI